MKKVKPLIFVVLVLIIPLLLSLQSPEKKKGLTIFMAASTTNLVEELAELYKTQNGVEIKLNSASSGVLSKQIINGAEADIFISASKKWINYLDDKVENRSIFVNNSLVLISSQNSEYQSFKENNNLFTYFDSKLSIGDPEHVPAGSYAKDVLRFYGWYNLLSSRLLLASNARSALSVVEMGEIDLGIVYKTDALISRKVKILYQFPVGSHSKINYYCAELDGDNPYKNDFYNFLLTDRRAEELYIKYGFSLKDSGN